jgi:hypothetical protein
VLNDDRTFSVNVEGKASGAADGKTGIDTTSKTTAVTLSTTSERIECLRLALFHVCSLAANTKMDTNAAFALYEKVIEQCKAWEPKKAG